MRAPTALRWIEYTLLVVGLLLLGRWTATATIAHRFQAEAARELTEERAGTGLGSGLEGEDATRAPAAAVAQGRRAGSAARPEAGRSVGRIVIPRIGLSAMIGEGTDGGTLERAVGHVRGTPLPGECGNVSLAGHRDTFFKRLGRLGRGDLIRISTAGDDFSYRLTATRVVGPRRVDLLHDSHAELTLVTCYPFHVIGPAPARYLVQACPIAPRGRPEAVAMSPAPRVPNSGSPRHARHRSGRTPAEPVRAATMFSSWR